jgi:hypothetical protein
MSLWTLTIENWSLLNVAIIKLILTFKIRHWCCLIKSKMYVIQRCQTITIRQSLQPTGCKRRCNSLRHYSAYTIRTKYKDLLANMTSSFIAMSIDWLSNYNYKDVKRLERLKWYDLVYYFRLRIEAT